MKTKTEIMNGLSRKFGKASLKLKKYSPEILVGAGVIGGVASAVMACKATLKVNEVVEEHQHNIEKIHVAAEKGITEAGKEYTEEDCKKDLTIAYVQTGVKLAKNYAPAIAVGTLSVASILTGHNMMRKRYLATAAAYSILDKSFKDYRGRVIERFGKELDQELRYNIKAKEVEEVVVNEDGSESVVKKTVNVVDPNDVDDFSRIWYEGNPGWTKDPERNLLYLKNVQRWLTEKLHAQGYLFLNDAYEALGFNRTKHGQIIGWVYDDKNPIGDNFVDFGLYDTNDPAKARFVNGDERNILITFNHDGNILEYI